MLQRERYLNTVKFRAADRIPLVEWPIREATMKEWLKQGYPLGKRMEDFFGLDEYSDPVPVNMGLYPEFTEKIIEKSDNYKIWIDNLGATRKDFLEDATPGFVTRSWLRFPVENRQDFYIMGKRYDPQTRERYPEKWKEKADTLNKSEVVTHLTIPFLFWTARDWMGFENLCLAFYDQPKLIEEIFEFLTDFYIETLKRGIGDVKIDIVELEEDMAYKQAPMISPEMFRKYMSPHYRRFIGFLKSNGVDIVFVDCDGYPGGLIPQWIDTGVDGMSPVEIAAGNNLLKLRAEYPRFAMWGGIDKRELAKDRKSIYNEVISKVPSMIEKGGYIPHVDHAIPPDVPLANYIYFRELIHDIALGKQ